MDKTMQKTYNKSMCTKLEGFMKAKSIIYSIDREKLVNLINSSSTVTEVLAFFGLKNRGNNYKTLYKRLDEETIDIAQLRERTLVYTKSKLTKFKKIPNEEIFIENSTYNSTQHLKARILEGRILEEKCAKCTLTNLWNGKPLSLQIDHINGKNDDNRIGNLRFLCPNCHSQTPTYAGKKLKNILKLKCKSCDKQTAKSSKSGICFACSVFTKRKVQRPPVDELKNQVTLYGYTVTGKMYGVSDNAIRKWIKAN
jgi:Zn finger protein HypA/HybF involved in hydrogenase expression